MRYIPEFVFLLTTVPHLNDAVVPEPWMARLELGFKSVLDTGDSRARRRTVLAHRRHQGPLLVQKCLYPEGEEICHAIVLHPPAGIAGGDVLELDVELGSKAHAALSTPSATRWYKANGSIARQDTHIVLKEGARLDWLPQENLFFDAAQAEVSITVEADEGAAAIGWDAVMLGRDASGERFETGRVRLSCHFRRAGQSIWREQGNLLGADPLIASPVGLAGMPIVATFWALGAVCTPALAQSVAPLLPWSDQLRAGSTALPGGIVLVRIIGQQMEPVRALLERLWTGLRPAVLGVPAQPLRLWTS